MTLDKLPRSVLEMVEIFRAHSVPDWLYAINKISGDEVYGISKNEEGNWITYYCERGKMTEIRTWPNEESAVHELFTATKEIAEYQGRWKA